MKSNNALNKVAHNSPLNVKLREIHDVKQSVNNSHLPDEVKKEIMKRCDQYTNMYWRWHYEGKEGYEIIQRDARNKIARVFAKHYGLVINVRPEHIYATDEFINAMVVSPHEGNKYRWLLRIAPMATFDRWANSTVIEKDFGSVDEVVNYLDKNQTGIYQHLFEALSREVVEERERVDYES
jgi:hypothetical protein